MMLYTVVEGDTDIPVVEKLAASVGFAEIRVLDQAGKVKLDANLSAFNGAAHGFPYLVLRDLDRDAPCAPALKRGFVPSRWMAYRVAVREVEAWLMADASGLAEFLHVPRRHFPVDPDAEEDPTRTIVQLARRSSRKSIRRAIVPGPGDAQVGGGYEAAIIEFASIHWNVERACAQSNSLSRARRSLEDLARRWDRHLKGRR